MTRRQRSVALALSFALIIFTIIILIHAKEATTPLPAPATPWTPPHWIGPTNPPPTR